MNPYIFGINIIWAMFEVHVYDHTHFCVHVGHKKAQNGTLDIQTLGATDFKHGKHTEIDLGVTWLGSFLVTPLSIGV